MSVCLCVCVPVYLCVYVSAYLSLFLRDNFEQIDPIDLIFGMLGHYKI